MSIRQHPIAYLALFISLGGTAYAATSLPPGSVGTRQLRNGAVTDVKVRAHSLTARVLAPGARSNPKTTVVKGTPPPQGSSGCPPTGTSPGCGEPYPAGYTFTPPQAVCPAGTHVVGGGFTSQGDELVTASQPASTRAWTVTFKTTTQVDAPIGRAIAVCQG
jgi:hypothetical protein